MGDGVAAIEVKRTDTSVPLDRAEVVQLAGDLLDERGVHNFKLGDVAAAAGVTQPALYRHVDGASDLWRALGLETRHTLADRLNEASAGRSGADAVRAVAHAWRNFGRTHPGRYRSTDRAPMSGDSELEAAAAAVMAALGASLRGYELGDEGTSHAVVMFRSALHGFVTFELSSGLATRPDETFEHLLDMLCVGFSASTEGMQLADRAS